MLLVPLQVAILFRCDRLDGKPPAPPSVTSNPHTEPLLLDPDGDHKEDLDGSQIP
jgi:hypothetical protein